MKQFSAHSRSPVLLSRHILQFCKQCLVVVPLLILHIIIYYFGCALHQSFKTQNTQPSIWPWGQQRKTIQSCATSYSIKRGCVIKLPGAPLIHPEVICLMLDWHHHHHQRAQTAKHQINKLLMVIKGDLLFPSYLSVFALASVTSPSAS